MSLRFVITSSRHCDSSLRHHVTAIRHYVITSLRFVITSLPNQARLILLWLERLYSHDLHIGKVGADGFFAGFLVVAKADDIRQLILQNLIDIGFTAQND